MKVICKRIYEVPSIEDGRRILVDRLWPRGLKKDAAKIDDWLKDIAPSHELRKWFAHEADKWPEFERRYRDELLSDEKNNQLAQLASIAGSEPVTLLYAAKDTQRNNAVVLQKILMEQNST